MICELVFENVLTFKNRVKIDFTADKQLKRFLNNTIECKNGNVLKTIGIYGPNNTGKTSLYRAILSLWKIMSGQTVSDLNYAFSSNKTSYLSVTYQMKNGVRYHYEVGYNSFTHTIEHESLSTIETYESNSNMAKQTSIFQRRGKALSISYNEELSKNIFRGFSLNEQQPLLFSVIFQDEPIKTAQTDYHEFISSLLLVDLTRPISIKHTIDLLQKDEKARKFIKAFVKNCDLDISDFGYQDEVFSEVNVNEKISNIVSNNPNFIPAMKLYSVHHGYRVPSFIFDSVGTQKIMALSSFIYEALIHGRALIVDELDCSLHHIITRAILSLFNNELNDSAQLFFITHDLLLLDGQHLLRKDQIYLTNINEETGDAELISLRDKTSRTDGFRGSEDIAEFYLKGRFSHIPTPDLFSALEDLKNNE